MRIIKNLRILPKVRDSWSYLYVEHARIDQEDQGICLHDTRGRTHVPCAALTLLMLGPGTSITHAAVVNIVESGCLVAWCGEQGIRFYAQGMGETRSAAKLLKQVNIWADPARRMLVLRRMYEMRFSESLDPDLTLQQVRGKEGARVRAVYAEVSEKYGIPWSGRNYDRKNWDSSDPINRALSAANACLYGVCHAAIVAAGYSPSLGFVHTGKMLSFVYDVGDLYKTEFTIPAAFMEVAQGVNQLESRVRHRCRDLFAAQRILDRVVSDLAALFDLTGIYGSDIAMDLEPALPGELWDPTGNVAGGHNFGRGQS